MNVTLAARQPGSALKPIVYAAAMQRGWTPATILWDTPVSYPAGDGSLYEPKNYDEQWHGPQRLRMALANSLNIPAIRTIEFVGVEAFVELAHRMGITTLNDPQQYGLPLALGAGEVRLLDLTNVYSTIRNAGRCLLYTSGDMRLQPRLRLCCGRRAVHPYCYMASAESARPHC